MDILEGFDFLGSVVTKFKNISIASKIEIAKQAILKDMSDTVNHMDELILDITAKIDNSIKTSAEFKKMTKIALNEYFESINQELEFIKNYKT